MNNVLTDIGKSLSFLVYCLYAVIYDAIKFFIPYKYRCKSIANEIVLVTGAGNGIGKLLAKKLAKLDAKLVLWDIDEQSNKQTMKEIIEGGGKAFAFKCDLSKKEDIYNTSKEVQKAVGNVTILVNNAGIVTGKTFLDAGDNLIEKTIQVNLMAHFWTNKAFLPNMIENNHGHVVTVASMAGIVGVSGLCDYCASKFGNVGFDEALRNELIRLDKTGIKTTVVCPSYINTGMFDGVESKVPLLDPEYVADKIVEAILTNQEILMLPRLMYVLSVIPRILPSRATSFLLNEIYNVNKSMDGYVGRKKTQ